MINIVLILLSQTICSTQFVNANNDQNEKIQELEKTKNDLYKEILTAIDDGVETLLQINETDGNIGVNHMKELKKQLTELNSTDGVFDTWLEITNITQNSRRSQKKKIILDILDIANVFKDKKSVIEKKKQDNTEDLQKRLQKWLTDRQAEKERIRQYKQKQRSQIASKFEKCPRFGTSRKRKGNAGETNVKYPCCRKCCKKSYMGCL